MKMEIVSKKENALYARTEVRFTVDHEREATPGRNAVAEEIAKQLKTKRECVVVAEFVSEYGIGKSTGYAKVYNSKKDALNYENPYLLKRNGIMSDEEAAKAAAKAAEAPKE
ncbi:MAG: 30S ribosomal protein S24e [Candidatus Methanomethylophilus sp.]|nr:30S ribosomal protein S24e [Methanomethylophilus sp.]